MSGVRWQLRAAFILLGGAVRGALQYRADIVFTMIAGALYNGAGFATVWVVLDRFEVIAGWNIGDMALLYGMRLVAHGLWLVPFNQLDWFSEHVREGSFDRYLVRPASPLLQLLTTRIQFSPFGDLISGLVVLGVAMSHVTVDWGPLTVAYLVFALIGGALIEGGIQLALSSIAFRTLKADQVKLTVDSVFNLFGNYPARIFGTAGQLVLSVIPVVFVAYLPASVLLGRVETTGVPAVVAWLSPLAGLVVAAFSHEVWRRMLRGYQSSGT